MPNLQKVPIIASLFLEPKQFVWSQWICEYKKKSNISWLIFTKELISCHDDVKRNSVFTQLKIIRQNGRVSEHVQQFQNLSLIVEGIPYDKLLDIFVGTLKDSIQHEVHLFKPTSLENDFILARKLEIKNMVMPNRRSTYNTYRENNVPSSNPIQRLTSQKFDEIRDTGIFFNCDMNYSKGHKCG